MGLVFSMRQSPVTLELQALLRIQAPLYPRTETVVGRNVDKARCRRVRLPVMGLTVEGVASRSRRVGVVAFNNISLNIR